MIRSGAELFARYAYPPNELGYCGPADSSILLRRDADADAHISRHARQFEGAWVYLELIAAAAEIADPLDRRVVEAYWLGNELLELIDRRETPARLQARLPPQPGASWTPGRPQHGYQVFAVYPWVGLLGRRPAGDGPALGILDRCRIRWGEVIAIDGDRVRVTCAALDYQDGSLRLGAPREQTAALSKGDRSLLARDDAGSVARSVRIGDTVAMHWDWVCDVLNPSQVARLADNTADQLAVANAALTSR